MKLIRKLSLFLALCLVLTGCGGGSTPETSQPAQNPTEVTQAPTVPDSQVRAAFGEVVGTGDLLFYWQYTNDSFESTSGYRNRLFPYVKDARNQLVCRSADGTETVIYTGPGAGVLALTGDALYFATPHYGDARTVYSCNYRGGDLQEYGSGALVWSDGDRVLVQTKSGIDQIADGSRRTLAAGSFLTMLDGTVYYETGSYEEPYVLWSVDPDTGTANQLYQAGEKNAIRKLILRDGKLYFSCGELAGTGMIFQGGQILSMTPGDSQVQVVCSAEQAGFTLDEQGKVHQDGPTDWATYDSDTDRRFISGKDAVYCMDPVTGNPVQIFTAADLADLELGQFGIHDGDALVNAWAVKIGDRAFGMFVSSYTSDHVRMNPDRDLRKAVMVEKDLKTGECRIVFDSSVRPPMCIVSDPVPSDELVSDAFTCVTASGPDGDYTFHLPRINLDTPAAKQINQEILDTFLADARQSIDVINTTYSEFGNAETGFRDAKSKSMSYTWNVHNGILSLTVVSQDSPTATPVPIVLSYTVDSTTAEAVPDDTLLEAYGITREDIPRALAMDFLNGVQESVLENYRNDIAWCLGQVVDMSNQTNLKLFIDQDGDLCCKYTHFWFAGATRSTGSAKLVNYEENPHYSEFFE